MQARPYTIFTRNELDTIRRRLEDCLATWCEKWFVAATALPSLDIVDNIFVTDALSVQACSAELGVERQAQGATCRVAYSASAIQKIYTRTTGDQVARVSVKAQQASLESQLVKAVFEDFLNSILSTLSAEVAAVEPASAAERIAQGELPTYKGSGTVVASIRDHESTFILYLSQKAARALAGKSIPAAAQPIQLTSRKALIGHGSLKVQVTAGEAELRLADLMDLKLGNVVLLNLRPDQPFTVETTDTHQKICSAYLGKRDGNKAVELINP